MIRNTGSDRMVVVGRITASFAVTGSLLLIALLAFGPEIGRPESTDIRFLDWIGLAVALSIPATWGLAIWHWGTRYPAGKGKASWGLAVILGFVVGAAIYWYRGASRSGAGAPLSSGMPVKGG